MTRFYVIARSACDEAIHTSTSRAMDCFAEPVIGRRFAPTRWLAMMTRLLPPHLVRHIYRELQLGPLLFLGQDVAFLGRGEAALRRHRELLERREFCGLHQPPLDVFLFLELTELRGDDADHDHLVALRQIA